MNQVQTSKLLASEFENAPTPLDLWRHCHSSRIRIAFAGLDDASKDELREAYRKKLVEISGRYKLNDLESLPLHVDTVDTTHNEENGTTYITINGHRRDTDEPISVRTRANELMEYFQAHESPCNVMFLRIDPRRVRGNAGNGFKPFWLVKELRPLSQLDPFTEDNDGNG